MLIVYPRPPPEPASVIAPVPGNSPDWWMLANNTSDRCLNTSAVPLPWWTSQSMTRTRSMPSSRIAGSAAIATLLNRQKPIARSRSAWWPEGRSPQNPTPHPSPIRSRTSAHAPPAACSAAR
jgi:hypothetical protein